VGGLRSLPAGGGEGSVLSAVKSYVRSATWALRALTRGEIRGRAMAQRRPAGRPGGGIVRPRRASNRGLPWSRPWRPSRAVARIDLRRTRQRTSATVSRGLERSPSDIGRGPHEALRGRTIPPPGLPAPTFTSTTIGDRWQRSSSHRNDQASAPRPDAPRTELQYPSLALRDDLLASSGRLTCEQSALDSRNWRPWWRGCPWDSVGVPGAANPRRRLRLPRSMASRWNRARSRSR